MSRTRIDEKVMLSPRTYAARFDGEWVVYTCETEGTKERISKQAYPSLKSAREAYLTGRIEWDYGQEPKED